MHDAPDDRASNSHFEIHHEGGRSMAEERCSTPSKMLQGQHIGWQHVE